jgi:hypothetical protein
MAIDTGVNGFQTTPPIAMQMAINPTAIVVEGRYAMCLVCKGSPT